MNRVTNTQTESKESARIPNDDPVGTDRALCPIEVTIPMVLIRDTGDTHCWHPQAMDRSTAERFVAAIDDGHSSAQIVEVKIILPAACDITDVLSVFTCEPVRIALTEHIDHDDPLSEIANGILEKFRGKPVAAEVSQ